MGGGDEVKGKIKIPTIGLFTYNEGFKQYEGKSQSIHWSIEADDKSIDLVEKVKLTEELFMNLKEFEEMTKQKVAEALIDFKNEQWFEYDENDEELDWDAVDAGEYDMTIEGFVSSITLLDIMITNEGIYCEYEDGNLFGGHRIHAYFDKKGEFIKADI